MPRPRKGAADPREPRRLVRQLAHNEILWALELVRVMIAKRWEGVEFPPDVETALNRAIDARIVRESAHGSVETA